MTSNGNDVRRRKLLVPSPLNLENLSESLISFDDYVCSSPKAPKSPKFCFPKGELPKRSQTKLPKRRHCPQCIICIEDLIIFDDEPMNKENGKPSGCRQRPIVMTNCGHAFHTGCINKWFMEHKDKEL
ncbi:unnamed protein product [Orchesella dallaii]|uniref:RING-type domain-containing protein n=1 Tax=Orchesella dallaii TaxID=48710 RepID=A0ABP1QIH0_9HEXA